MDNLKMKDPYVMKLVKAYDEKMQTLASGGLNSSRASFVVDVERVYEDEVVNFVSMVGVSGGRGVVHGT